MWLLGSVLLLNERQKGNSVLEVIHNQNVDEDNNDFIINYFNNL